MFFNIELHCFAYLGNQPQIYFLTSNFFFFEMFGTPDTKWSASIGFYLHGAAINHASIPSVVEFLCTFCSLEQKQKKKKDLVLEY